MISLLAQSLSPPNSSQRPWLELSLLNWREWGFELRIGVVWVLICLASLFLLKWIWPIFRLKWLRGFRPKIVRISFSGPEIELCPDHEIRRIAYQAWVEIQTRKVGLPFDEEHDVIAEIYDSWYQVFPVLRDLCKGIPPECLAEGDACKLVNLLFESINEGLRPHLTRWQAKFRRWYSHAINATENKELTPQEIQRKYPDFSSLVSDMRAVNTQFVSFAESLLKVAKA